MYTHANISIIHTVPYSLISTAMDKGREEEEKKKYNGKILKIGMFTHSLGMSTEIIRISHQIKKCIHRFTAAEAPPRDANLLG